ncbi:MAG: MAPEG family protein [Deltaproteobacteria bacterium]
MEAVAIVTVLALLEYFAFSLQVGKARGEYKIDAPATTGHPIFERTLRVQQNTLEQLVLFLPGLWLFATYVNAEIAAVLGLVFIVGRALYARAYVAEPGSRTIGFVLGLAAEGILLIGALVGAILSY